MDDIAAVIAVLAGAASAGLGGFLLSRGPATHEEDGVNYASLRNHRHQYGENVSGKWYCVVEVEPGKACRHVRPNNG